MSESPLDPLAARAHEGASTTLSEKVAHVLAAAQTRPHTCHWPGCEVEVPPARWGCKRHWFLLPQAIRNLIWRAYRPGQEITRTPSPAYLKAARVAEEWIQRYGLELEKSGKQRELFRSVK